jgi:hypothetical protein
LDGETGTPRSSPPQRRGSVGPGSAELLGGADVKAALDRLATLFLGGKDVSAKQVAVYAEYLGDLTRDQLDLAVDVLAQTWTPPFPRIPTVAEIRGAIGGSKVKVDVEADRMFEAVVELGEYNPESGAVWRPQRIRETLGLAALEAFVAAGGQTVFSQLGDGTRAHFARRTFVEVYRGIRQTQSFAALPSAAQKLLGGGR